MEKHGEAENLCESEYRGLFREQLCWFYYGELFTQLLYCLVTLLLVLTGSSTFSLGSSHLQKNIILVTPLLTCD